MHNDLPRIETQQVRRFLLENYLFSNDESALANDDSLLQKGIVDSTGMMELIAFLEGTFRVSIADAEMIPENLDSVNGIVAFLGRKLGHPTLATGAV